MAESKNREIFIAGVFGIVGVVIGSVATGLMNAHIQEQQQAIGQVSSRLRRDHSSIA